MAARLDELCDVVKAALEAAAHGDATVEVTDKAEVDFESISGRVVFVTGLGYEDRGPVSRRHDGRAYQIGVQVVEKYAGDEPAMPLAWRRERSEWVERTVFELLNDPRDRLDGAYSEAAQVLTNRDEQVGKELFWEKVAVVLVEEC